jgi:NEDD8-activating enzyme E1 regulatory subunit
MRQSGNISVAENFDEAIRVHFDCYKTEEAATAIIRHILDDPKTESPETDFWLFVAALKKFESKNLRLPVSGQVPDMISTTQNFL